MDTSTRRGIAAALRECLRFIWDGKPVKQPECSTSFICVALMKSGHPARYAAQDEVMRRLLPYSSVYNWLKQFVSHRVLTQERVQAHRVAWVNKLIEEFEGD